MKENLIKYNVSFFKDNWETLINIKIEHQNIPSFMRSILKSVYEKKGKWINTYEKIKKGVFNTGHKNDINGRSLLNYIDTNYSSFTILINWINKQIIQNKINKYTQIDFYLGIWVNEIEKFFKIITENKNIIFNNESDILNDILNVINKTYNYGNKIEEITINKLKKINGITNLKKSDFGEKQDMFKGIDVEFAYKGIKWTIQCKSYCDIKLNNGIYIISGISHAKDYDPDIVKLYAFYNYKKGFYIFKNSKRIQRNKNTFYIPIDLKKNI